MVPKPKTEPSNLQVRVRKRVRKPEAATDPADKPFAHNVVERAIADIKPSPRNARKHSKKQIHLIAESMRKFGFVSAILIDADGELVAGHGRLEAAKILGLTKVPTVLLDHLDADQIRALRIADNRLAERSSWDTEILKMELGALIDSGFEVDLTGFETAKIDLILDADVARSKVDPAEMLPDLSAVSVTKEGDLWLLGEHRLLCADPQNRDAYRTLLNTERAQMAFTAPRYEFDGRIAEFVKPNDREVPTAVSKTGEPEFTRFLSQVFEQMAAASEDGALLFSCSDGAHLHTMLNAGYGSFDELEAVITWDKGGGEIGSLYCNQTDLITLWKKGKAPHISNSNPGRRRGHRTNLWAYAGVTGSRKGGALKSYPTVMPCAMVTDAIKDCSKPKGIILDPFGGSGTTLIAAAKTKRRGYVMEVDPSYVDLVIRRWETLFKAQARHSVTGKTFAEMAVLRGMPSVIGSEGDDDAP